MTLDTWLKRQKQERGLTEAAFALLIGKSQSAVNRYRNQLRLRLDQETMRAIERETAGAVTPNDFYGIATKKRRAA